MVDAVGDPVGLTPGERGAFLGSPIGKGLGPRDLATMLSEGYARPATWVAGQRVARWEEPQQNFLILLSGRLEVARSLADGNRQVLDFIEPGQPCGAVSACAPQPRWPADVSVVDDARGLLIHPGAFLAPDTVPACAADPTRIRLLQNLTRILAGRAQHLHQRLQLVTVGSLRGKISAYLLQLPRTHAGVVTLPGTRQQVAETIFASRASMTRELGRMASDGLIAVRGRAVGLLDPAGLADAAGA